MSSFYHIGSDPDNFLIDLCFFRSIENTSSKIIFAPNVLPANKWAKDVIYIKNISKLS